MTPAQADKRIIVSRQRLHAGDCDAAGEINALQEIAEAHPGKAAKIDRLVLGWLAVLGKRH